MTNAERSEESLQVGRAEQEKLVQSVSTMNEVAKRIKQIRELPSEVPTDNHPLTKVEFPDEGEVLTYMQGYDYPYRGYPYYEFVDRIDVIKKLIRNLQSGFYHGLKDRWYRWLLVPLVPFLGRSVFWAFTYTFKRVIDRTPMRPNRYSQFVQEVYRAFSVSWSDESPQITELRHWLRDIECMILEFDNAYRFRGQDLAVEINKENLRKNPIEELCRLIDIWIEREKVIDVKNSWLLLKLFVRYYLRFDKPLQKIFTRTLLELDLSKCAMTDNDKYFAVPRKDYNFGFQINPTEADQKLISKALLQRSHDDNLIAIRAESTIEHDMLKRTYDVKINQLPPTTEQNLEEQNKQIQESFQKDSLALDSKFNDKLLQAEKAYLQQKVKL